MLTVAVLISGTGSNLRALLDAAADPGYPAQIVVVGADREAEGFAHAEEYGIPSFMVPWAQFGSREEWGAELGEQLAVWRPDLVVLSGLMRLLPAPLVDEWSPRIINTHPAYLPEFPGAHGVRDALAFHQEASSQRRAITERLRVARHHRASTRLIARGCVEPTTGAGFSSDRHVRVAVHSHVDRSPAPLYGACDPRGGPSGVDSSR